MYLNADEISKEITKGCENNFASTYVTSVVDWGYQKYLLL